LALEKRDAGGWTMTRPIAAPADGPTITELLNSLERLRAAKFVSESATPEETRECGLEPPAARVAVLQEGWDAAKLVAFGKEKYGQRCARNLGRASIVMVNSDIWPKVTTSIADLRRKEAVGLSQYRLTSISLKEGDGPALVLTRGKESTWNVTGKATGTVRSDSIDNFSRALAGIRAVTFDDHPARPLVDGLLAHPAVEIVLEQEPEAEGGTPAKQRLLFGAPTKEGRLPLYDPAWPSVGFCAKDALAEIERQAGELITQATAPPPPTATEATGSAPPAAGAAPSAGAAAAPPPAKPPG
ncbi:MAG TPA: DUF4340 domain-containing protein, partial [Dongiaceae bacterium]|nr:DUF4340 domain-containing protein [Dongiaceae bacterium]